MRHLQQIAFVIALFVLTIISSKQTFAQNNTAKETKRYLGTNPVAIPLAFSIEPELKRFLPIAAGNEYGANLVGGFFFRPNQSVEARLSLANMHQVAFVGQLHLGMNYFLQKDKILRGQKGWYLGGYAKCWDFYNRLTSINFHNISPYLTLGYMNAKNRFLFDFRINQTLAVYSWSSLEHTRGAFDWMLSPWPEFIPVLPTFTFTVSYKL